MNGGLYKVVGGTSYQTHAPGTVFEERLSRRAERRAIARGTIVLLERVDVSVPAARRLPRQGSFRLPPGGKPVSVQREAPAGASLVEEGGTS